MTFGAGIPCEDTRPTFLLGGSVRLKSRSGGAYFLNQSQDVEYFPSGAAVLDCVLGGGGWALSRVINIVGDKSTGKTGLAMEACINFIRTFPKGKVRYAEPESALSKGYAKEMGVPVDRIEFADDDSEIDTVEDWFEDVEGFADSLNEGQPGLYILDSLDALTSEAEKKRKIGEASYGDGKAKQMSQAWRRLIRVLKQQRVTVIIISQVRDNIGVTFGERYTRSGGKALDFYASQVLWLAQVAKIAPTINGVSRVTGIVIKAMCKKNKVGIPFRDCTLTFKFGYGLDDVESNARWLASVKKSNLIQVGLAPDKVTRWMNQINEAGDIEYKKARDRLDRNVREVWKEVEQAFLPTHKKY